MAGRTQVHRLILLSLQVMPGRSCSTLQTMAGSLPLPYRSGISLAVTLLHLLQQAARAVLMRPSFATSSPEALQATPPSSLQEWLPSASSASLSSVAGPISPPPQPKPPSDNDPASLAEARSSGGSTLKCRHTSSGSGDDGAGGNSGGGNGAGGGAGRGVSAGDAADRAVATDRAVPAVDSCSFSGGTDSVPERVLEFTTKHGRTDSTTTAALQVGCQLAGAD